MNAFANAFSIVGARLRTIFFARGDSLARASRKTRRYPYRAWRRRRSRCVAVDASRDARSVRDDASERYARSVLQCVRIFRLQEKTMNWISPRASFRHPRVVRGRARRQCAESVSRSGDHVCRRRIERVLRACETARHGHWRRVARVENYASLDDEGARTHNFVGRHLNHWLTTLR
jgi:hypothetical protein